MQLLLLHIRILHHLQTHVVKALQRADTRRSHSYRPTLVGQQLFYGLPLHSHRLRMHLVLAYRFALHGLKRSGTHVQRQLLTLNAMSIQVAQHTLREVQAGSRSSHTAFYLRIHRLIRSLVALLRLSVQVWRDRQLTHRVDDLGKRHVARPVEGDTLAGSLLTHPRGTHPLTAHLITERAFFPFLRVTHQTQPLAMSLRLEHLFIVGRQGGLQQENLNQRTRTFTEMQTRLNHLRVVENHQLTLRQILRQVVEHILPDSPLTVYQQLRVVALSLRELRYPFVRQLVVVFTNMYFLYIHTRCKGIK